MTSPSPTPQPADSTSIPLRPVQTPFGQQDPQDISSPTTHSLDLLPHLKTWLTKSSPSIQKFWIGAHWRTWARFDLYLHLLTVLPSPDYLLNHSLPLSDIYQSSPSPRIEEDLDLDIHIEPSDSSLPQLGIILRCENVNENCGSFERFRAEMDGDIERIVKVGREGMSGWFEGMRVFVVGVSGPFLEGMENEDAVWRCRPEPTRVEIDGGEMNLWVYEIGGERRKEEGLEKQNRSSS